MITEEHIYDFFAVTQFLCCNKDKIVLCEVTNDMAFVIRYLWY